MEMLQSALAGVHGGLDTVETMVETADEVRRGVRGLVKLRSSSPSSAPAWRSCCNSWRPRSGADLHRAALGLTELERRDMGDPGHQTDTASETSPAPTSWELNSTRIVGGLSLLVLAIGTVVYRILRTGAGSTRSTSARWPSPPLDSAT